MTQNEFKRYIIERDNVLNREDCIFLMHDCSFVRGMKRINQDEPPIYEITFDDYSTLRFTAKKMD